MRPKKAIVSGLKKIEYGSAIAVRLTRFTGKSKTYLHPKHLIAQNPWYITHIKKGDTVVVLSGIQKGKSGKVIKIDGLAASPVLMREGK